ncbi:hypothetical protein LTR86_007340 [Recurvomyces mirabilis]|nr:hypothetical protein LTR86_007340 [Recurvomyces mirabilis]
MDSEETTSAVQNHEENDSTAQLYTAHFWSRAMAKERRMMIHSLFLPLLYTALLMWACLGLFWGSLITNNHLGRLNALVVNLESDQEGLGTAVIDAVTNAQNSLDWKIYEKGRPGLARHMVLNEDVWAAVEISANATSALSDALATGNAVYNPTEAITFFYASARNQITVNSHVAPAVLGLINGKLHAVAVEYTTSFLRNNINNTAALDYAIRCPQCLTAPFVLSSVDLVPFDSPTASGSVMVGMIFLLTFTFSVFQILRTNGQLIGAKLRLSSSLCFRTAASLGTYFLLALTYTLINRAFGVPLSGKFNDGSGFVVYWMLNWSTMAAGISHAYQSKAHDAD